VKRRQLTPGGVGIPDEHDAAVLLTGDRFLDPLVVRSCHDDDVAKPGSNQGFGDPHHEGDPLWVGEQGLRRPHPARRPGRENHRSKHAPS
jgi:hypothetical protein